MHTVQDTVQGLCKFTEGKVPLELAKRAHVEVDVQLHAFLSLEFYGGNWSVSRPNSLTLYETAP